MKIIELKAANVKRLTAVEITPTGEIVEVRGDNAAGKSSVLDSIAYALGGQRLCPKESPLRQGQTKAHVEVTLDDIIVRRTWSLKGTSLTVKNRDGVPATSPQAVLDKLCGKLTFDPLEFARMEPAKQREALLGLVGVGKRLGQIDGHHADVFANRTEWTRELGRLRSLLESSTVPEDTPDEPVDVNALLAEMDTLDKQRVDNDRKRRDHREQHAELDTLMKSADAIATHLSDLRQEAAEDEQRYAEVTARIEALHDLVEAERIMIDGLKDPNCDGIRQRIANAGRVNELVLAKQERANNQAEFDNADSQWKQHTTVLDGLADEKRAVLCDAEYPIDGLGFEKDYVTYNGIPFEQASQAERLRVSVAIAMAANPELRVLLIRDGSLLDEASLKALYDQVKANDYQLWIERVGRDGETGVVIEDGRVADTLSPEFSEHDTLGEDQ